MVFDYDILYRAWQNSSRGKHGAPNQARYEYYLEENLYHLQAQLESGTFCPSPLRTKQIYIPKRRVAQVPSLVDKIVQHAICDNYAYDALTKPLVKETAACIRGRGARYAVDLFKQSLHRFYRKCGHRPYILKCDIHSYFATIPHGRLKALVERYILDDDVKRIMLQFVVMTEVGLPLGLQQSQLLANLYLSEMDHKIKEQFHAKYYGRYMDDFYIISDSKAELQTVWSWLADYLAGIGLQLNPKTDIYHGDVDFLGFTFRLTETGKVIVRLRKDKRKAQKNRVRLMARQIEEGKLFPEQAAQSYAGWRTHALEGNCRNLVLKMDERFDNRLREAGYELKIEGRSVEICPAQLRN